MQESRRDELHKYLKVAKTLPELREDKLEAAQAKVEDGRYFSREVAEALAELMLGKRKRK